jgi:ammonium transporter, Amt family
MKDMFHRFRHVLWGLVAVSVVGAATTAFADDAGKTSAGAVEAAAPSASSAPASVNTGDNAWMLVSSALVLFMTAPGLAMFYCGLVRKKNVLSVMMQCVFLMGMMTVIWAIYGYSLAFGGGDNPWLGDLRHLFMKGVAPEWVGGADGKSVAPMFPDTSIPMMSHMLFQLMFFIITPALICGAFAERMKFSAMALFSIAWGTIVYLPLAHWVWGGGLLAYPKDTALLGGALDFAGGTVVHISSGVSALVCALWLGKRIGFGHEPMPPHNLTYTAIGATMLWVGWFGFNAGSALAAGEVASSAFAATHFAAAAGALTWPGLEWLIRGKPTLLGACSGAVAGLVCVTPAAGFITPMPALLFGVAVGAVCFWACTALKSRFKYDDALDAFGVHGVGGTLGAVLTGIFATRATGATASLDHGKTLGLLEGGSRLPAQIAAVLITWALAGVATFVILKVIDLVIGVRVSEAEEVQGLDLSQHGEEGYILI